MSHPNFSMDLFNISYLFTGTCILRRNVTFFFTQCFFKLYLSSDGTIPRRNTRYMYSLNIHTFWPPWDKVWTNKGSIYVKTCLNHIIECTWICRLKAIKACLLYMNDSALLPRQCKQFGSVEDIYNIPYFLRPS